MVSKPIIPEVLPPESPLSSDLETLQRVAILLDRAVPIPGTRMGVGLDGIVGLVPWLGDVLGALMSGWILIGAMRHRVPRRKFARMVANVIVDLSIGSIPVAGDVFDTFFPQNLGNVKLLLDHRDTTRPPRSYREIALRIALVVASLFVVSVSIAAAAAWLVLKAIAALF